MATEAVEAPAEIAEFAPAKVNLTLHVTGRRPDGYHLLDSLVVFAGIGDRVTARPAPALSLALEGPRARAIPAGDDNLVLRAARLLQQTRADRAGAALVLEKRLPAASGLGGGSSDAAAALRALARLWRLPPIEPDMGLPLGADVPVCLRGQPVRMRGIGEALSPCPALPPLWLVLANPGIETPTAAVFSALERRDNPPMPEPLPHWPDAAALARWLSAQRNDLEPPARALCPIVSDVLAALRAEGGCLLARMSGSGATCFGLFATAQAAGAAADRLAGGEPSWWVAAAPVLGADQTTRSTT